MSIHVNISPEAQSQLAHQKRNSTISAILIAILICALLGAILWLISLSPLFTNQEELIGFTTVAEVSPPLNDPIHSNQVETRPSPPAANPAKMIASLATSPTAVPVVNISAQEPSTEFGSSSNDFGDSWVPGDGKGFSGITIPASMKKRCSAEDRIQRIIKDGGKAEYDEQVITALRYLKNTQNPDGSWHAAAKPPAAMTGLALLCYLGHCETPVSAEFGETVQKAIMFLVNMNQTQKGFMGKTGIRTLCYEHPIATYAIAEAYTLCKEFQINIPGLTSAVKDAADQIISNQHTETGGWDYDYDTSGARGGDTSVVCWHMQALKALKMTKINIIGLNQAAERGLEYLEGAIKPSEDQMGYGTNGNGTSTMTAGGVLCFQQWGKGRKTFPRKAIKFISSKQNFNYQTDIDLYQGYYASQAMINAQGTAWSKFNQNAMTSLAKSQNNDGSWPAPGHLTHGMNENDALYATCLATLMLEVYYRFLPTS